MNARDVFVRRPSCVSLWVAPAKSILSRTRQELELEGVPPPKNPQNTEDAYAVFKKVHQKGACTYTGRVRASSHEAALAKALETFPSPDALWWWIVPEGQIFRTEVGDEESLFEPANRKVFRHQSSFNTLTLMRRISANAAEIEDHDHES